jgi:predicted HTH transcriptional regulator
MILPSLPENLHTLHTFPHPEGKYFEFKSGIKLPINKVYETLCGFLNEGGGYMIFGINDRSLLMHGVNSYPKAIDRFILQIDNIHHSGRIVTFDNKKLTTDNIKVELIRLDHSHSPLIVITCVPTLFISYKVSHGSTIHRIGASNFRLGNLAASYTEEQLTQRLIQQYSSLYGQFTARMTALRAEHNTAIKRLETENQLLKQEVERLRLLRPSQSPSPSQNNIFTWITSWF